MKTLSFRNKLTKDVFTSLLLSRLILTVVRSTPSACVYILLHFIEIVNVYRETGQVPLLSTGRMTASPGITISGVHRFGRL